MKNTSPKKVIVVAGPTAVGKTAAAIHIAKYFGTQIISADSRQCFNELAVGVARPSAEELSQVQHYFIASHSIHEEVTAGHFEQFALQKTNELFATHDHVVMVGGTGLYIRAFCEGLNSIPSIDPSLRENIVNSYNENGIDWLVAALKEKDPLFATQGEMQNPQRMMRALEVVEATGKSILSFHDKEKTPRDFDIIKIGLELPREELVRNINARVDQMIAVGLVDEVKTLLPFQHLNALQTVGYTEIFDYLNGKISLDEAIEKIKVSTRQYAKRQMTWFKKDKEITWLHPSNVNEMIALATEKTAG